MPEMVTRFGASIDTDLLERFDNLVKRKGYVNRSEVLRDLMRDFIVSNEWEADDRLAIGTITLVYNHHTGDLGEKLTEIQHNDHNLVLSSLHVHLDAHNCLEVIVVRGPGKRIQDISDRLISAKGVLHGKLVITAVE